LSRNNKAHDYNLRLLREALIENAKQYPLLPGLCYTSAYDFVAQHGIDYQPQRWRAGRESIGAARLCFGNAIRYAGQYGLKYIEGFAVAPSGEVILHGWNTYAGTLFDSTWANTGVVYLGVEFSLERADDASWNGDASVLNDDKRNYPVFQKRWEGEDYGLKWPYSDRVEAFRLWKETGVYTPPASTLEWAKKGTSLS